MNYWFWLYLLLMPPLVLSIRPIKPWQQLIKLLVAIFICYVLMNLAVHSHWDLLNNAVNANPNATDEDFTKAAADGANILYMLIFGWLPALTYVGWWEAIRLFIHRKRVEKDKAFWFSIAVISLSTLFTFFALTQTVILKSPVAFLQVVLPPAAYVLHGI